MEENSLIKENNQSMNNNQPKNNNGIIVCLVVIIVLLAAALVYFVFLKKEDEKEPITPVENTEEKENREEDNVKKEEINKTIDENIYKTTNGKHTLNVKDYSKGNVTYDGQKYRFDGKSEVGKYTVYAADDVGGSQCGMYNFIVNNETHTLLDLDYKKAKYSVWQADDKYYFDETDSCVFGLDSYHGIYTEDMKKIGESYFGMDSNKNFYVYDNKSIIKYDKNANVIKKVQTDYILKNIEIGEASGDAKITKDNLYFVYNEGDDESDDKYYLLVDAMNEKEYKLAKVKDYYLEHGESTEESIEIPFTQKCPEIDACNSPNYVSKKIVYTFNIKTGELTQK